MLEAEEFDLIEKACVEPYGCVEEGNGYGQCCDGDDGFYEDVVSGVEPYQGQGERADGDQCKDARGVGLISFCFWFAGFVDLE